MMVTEEDRSVRDARIVHKRVNDNLTMAAIAKSEGLSTVRIRDILHAHGLKSKYVPDKGKFWKSRETTLIDMYMNTTMTPTQMAAEIGHKVTASAVSSQIMRLVRDRKVVPRDAMIREESGTGSLSAQAGARTIVAYKPPARPPIPIPESVLVAFKPSPASRPLTLRQLPATGCRWPLGDKFCAEPIDPTSRLPYCPCHGQLARRTNFAAEPPAPRPLPRV